MSDEEDVFDEDLVRELGLDPEDLNGPKLNKKRREGEPAAPAAAPTPAATPQSKPSAPSPQARPIPPKPAAPQQATKPQAKPAGAPIPPPSAKPLPPAPQVNAEEQIEEQALRVSRDVPVQLAAVLAKKSLKLQNILEYKLGDVIDFKKQPHDLLDLVANGKLIAKAELVMIDGSVGARIVKLIK